MQSATPRSPPPTSSSSSFTSTPFATAEAHESFGAKRRNSWNQPRQSFDDPFAMSPSQHAMGDATPTPAYPPAFPASHSPRPRLASQASLDSTVSVPATEGDDEVHLTSAPPVRWKDDTEAGQSSQPTRLSRPRGHYGETASTPRRTLGTLRTMSRNIRRASMRVVNLGVTLEDRPIRLDDEDEVEDKRRSRMQPGQEDAVPDVARERLRGRTIGLFGPKSKLRNWMLDFLLWRSVLKYYRCGGR